MTEILMYDRDGPDPNHTLAFLGALDRDDLMGYARQFYIPLQRSVSPLQQYHRGRDG